MQLRAEWISFLFKVIETQWRERLPLFPLHHHPSHHLYWWLPCKPLCLPSLPVNDSLHFTLTGTKEKPLALSFFFMKSEEIDQAREKRCDRTVWLCRSWLSWCGVELAWDKHVIGTKKALPLFFSTCCNRPILSLKVTESEKFAARQKLLDCTVCMKLWLSENRARCCCCCC